MLKNKERLRTIFIVILIIIMSGVIFFFQTKKIGFHEDEGYTLCSSVNPSNGLFMAYDDKDTPEWRTREFVEEQMTLSSNNYLNFKALYMNQAYDNHPPIFYTCVHFATMLFKGQFTKYSVFIVNIIAFIASCIVLVKTLKLLGKDHLIIPALILYGLSMGTISMVIFQRMYMMLTLSIMLYFYLSLKLYKNDFKFDKKLKFSLGISTIFGFLTQYFFAVYALFIFITMIIIMFKHKVDKKTIREYIICHVIYAIVGILLFVPCLKHLFFSDRGLKNLGNTGLLTNMHIYFTHLAYAFTISPLIMYAIFFIFAIATIYLYMKTDEKFLVFVSIIPSIFYFLIAVKMTSFQELRYIMAVIPFMVLVFLFILDKFFDTYFDKFKYKNIVLILIAIVLITNGFVFSKPKFLYENYKYCMDIAEANKDKSFVYIYDNFFNHMQSVPEMLTYKRTLLVNANKNEVQCIIDDVSLKEEGSFIMSIKSYMDNEIIIEEIKGKTDFKNITKLYETENSSEKVSNNYYLVSR